ALRHDQRVLATLDDAFTHRIGDLFGAIDEFAYRTFLDDTKAAVADIDIEAGGRERSGEHQFFGVLRNIDEAAGARIARPEPAHIDVAAAVELRKGERRERAIPAVDEIELLHAIEQRLGPDIGGELPAAHDDAAERTVLGRKLIVADAAVVEQAEH